MAKVRIRINLALLQANLGKEDGVSISEEEVKQFLRDSGFREDGQTWLVDEKDLGQLDPSEVTSVEPQ